MVTNFHQTSLAFVMTGLASYAALLPASYGQEATMSISLGQDVEMQMVHIPAGRIARGIPGTESAVPSSASAAPSTLTALSSIETPAFYISSKELTFTQLKSVLNDQRISSIHDRIVQTTGKDASNQYLRDAIDSPDFPAFSLSFDDVLAFCRELNRREGQENVVTSTIEGRRFRVPSHAEWQFACRAASTAEEAAQRPHFNRWVEHDAMPKETRAKIAEEWQKLGKTEAELTGSQSEILELFDARIEQEDAGGVPQEILGDYFEQALGVARDFSAVTSRLKPGGEGKPNAWGLYDMHDNVCEWVVKIDDQQQLLAFWQSAASEEFSEELLSKPMLALTGGGFSHAVNTKGAWKDFAIWGGTPIDRESGELKPYQLSEGVDTSARGVAADNNPGLRLVMDRTIRSDWFATVRREGLAANGEALVGFRTSAAEVGTKDQALRINQFADAYAALMPHSNRDPATGGHDLGAALARLGSSEQPAPTGRGLAALRASMAGASPSHKAPGSSDNAMFFRLAAEVVD